jgi:hypothetical protein
LAQESSPNGRDDEHVRPAGLASLLRSGWRDHRRHRTTLFGIFALASAAVIVTTLAANLISYAVGRPVVVVVLLEQIVPFFALGVWFGAGVGVSAIVFSSDHDASGLRDALRATRPQRKDLVTSGLLAGMVMVTAVTLLYYLPILFLPLFFGPPILVHVIAIDQLRFSAAATRARDLMAGEKLRAFGALMPVAFGTGTLMYAAPNLVATATDSLGVIVRQASAIVTRIVIDAVAVAFFAAVAYAMFVDIRRRRDRPAAKPDPPRDTPTPKTGPGRNRKKKR